MRVLVIGGCGHVGGLIVPLLKEQNSLRVMDLRPPKVETPGVEYVQGNVNDPAALATASVGRDALIYLAMGAVPDREDRGVWEKDAASAASSFDVNVKGVHLALDAARRAGIAHGVYASSLSVFQAMTWGAGEKRYYVDEDMPADAQPVYGFTKRLGEEVCRNATREWGMSVNVLRLCFPMSDDRWLSEAKAGIPTIATSATDVARAFHAALNVRAGCQVFQISGDYEQKLMRMTRAKSLLGWEPLSRPVTPLPEAQ